jgi:hypothetical protein
VTAGIGVLALLTVLVAPLAGMRGYERTHTTFPAYSALLLAAGIARTVQPVPQVLVFLLLTFAAALLLTPSFADRRVRLLPAAVAYGAVAWAAAILPGQTDWPWHGLLVVLGWLVVAAAVASLAGMIRVRQLEQAVYPVLLVWFVVVAVRLVAL